MDLYVFLNFYLCFIMYVIKFIMFLNNMNEELGIV